MPLVIPRRKTPLLRWASWFFLALGIALLGCVSYVLLDARLFQARENRRLNQTMKPSAELPAEAQPRGLPGTSSVVVEVQPVNIVPGSTIGRIEISRIGLDVIVEEGTEGRTLRRGVGHVTSTALPGQPGIVAIAGHRDTFFRPLRNIRQDDEIMLTTPEGTYRYRVDWVKVVGDGDTEVLSDSDEPVLTLVTCYPFYFVGPAPKRFIVRAHKL